MPGHHPGRVSGRSTKTTQCRLKVTRRPPLHPHRRPRPLRAPSCAWPSSSRRSRSAWISASANRWSTCCASASSPCAWPTPRPRRRARDVVYYAALLVNVGCHSDAHEQAKWFGDDIALKATKYRPRPAQLRGEGQGCGSSEPGRPPLHRSGSAWSSRLRGHRDVDDMMRSTLRSPGTRGALGLPADVRKRVGGVVRAVGRAGWPGELAGTRSRSRHGSCQFAEYVEVAHRVGGVAAAIALAPERSGTQFDPGTGRALLSDDADGDARRARRPGPGRR